MSLRLINILQADFILKVCASSLPLFGEVSMKYFKGKAVFPSF